MVVKAEDALTWSFALGMRDLWLRGRSSMLCGTRGTLGLHGGRLTPT